MFFFCIQFPGSLPRLKFADQNIINASKMKKLNTNRTGDKTYVWRKFACFQNSIDFFNVANLVSRKDKRINRWYLEHSLAEKMRLGHVRVGIKHMCDRFLKVVVTSIMYSWKIYTSCPFELQTWNTCLIYVDRDNPVLFVIECNVTSEKQNWRSSLRSFYENHEPWRRMFAFVVG